MARPNFPAALQIAPNAPRSGDGREAWCHDDADDIAQYGIAGRIWESAFLVESYARAPSTWTWDPPRTMMDAHKRVIVELGAGVGTAGLTTARALADMGGYAEVVLTDLPEVCPLLRRNAASFEHDRVHVHVRPLAWGDTEAAHAVTTTFPLTHILCSDLVYFPELLAPLLNTLLDLTNEAPHAEVVIAYKIRSLAKEQPFWTALGAWFDLAWTQCTIPLQAPAPFGTRATHFVHPPPCDAHGTPLDDYLLLIAHRKPHTLAWERPKNASALLSGMYIVHGEHVHGSGTDTFEWIMLSAASDSYLH